MKKVKLIYNPYSGENIILSKLDESISIGETKYDLYTNICKNYKKTSEI